MSHIRSFYERGLEIGAKLRPRAIKHLTFAYVIAAESQDSFARGIAAGCKCSLVKVEYFPLVSITPGSGPRMIVGIETAPFSSY